MDTKVQDFGGISDHSFFVTPSLLSPRRLYPQIFHKTHLKEFLLIFFGCALFFECARAFSSQDVPARFRSWPPQRIPSAALDWSPRDVSPMFPTISWLCLHKILHMLKSVTGDGVRPTDCQRESVRFGNHAMRIPRFDGTGKTFISVK